MKSNLRQATREDVGLIAYLILKWDAELPPHLRMLNGNAQAAERAANIAASTPEQFYTCLLEMDGVLVGGYCLHSALGIFSPQRYGQLLMWYVDPKYRGGRQGYQMLKDAISVTKLSGLAWLEVNPWADSRGAHKILNKLGFVEAVHTFVKRME